MGNLLRWLAGKFRRRKPPTLRERIMDEYPEAVFAFMDGYDDCIIGVSMRFGRDMPLLAYDYEKIIARHIEDGMTYDEAVEFFDYNQIGAWVGDQTPEFIQKIGV